MAVASITKRYASPAVLDISLSIPHLVCQIFAFLFLDNHASHAPHRLLALNVAQHTSGLIFCAFLMLLTVLVIILQQRIARLALLDIPYPLFHHASKLFLVVPLMTPWDHVYYAYLH